MKLLTIFLAITTVVFAALFFGCGQKNASDNRAQRTAVDSTDMLNYKLYRESVFLSEYEAMITDFTEKNGTPPDSLQKEKFAVIMSGKFDDLEWAKKYIAFYNKERDGLLRMTKMGKSVWFDKRTMDEIYAFYSKNNCDGLRIYFGKYTKYNDNIQSAEHDGQRDDTGDYDKRFSAILVTTKGGGKNYYVKVPSFRSPILAKIFQNRTDGPYDGIYNYSQLCPPETHCQGLP